MRAFLITIGLLLFTLGRLRAQNYPVQITTQLVAPFSGYLPDYTNPGEEKLKLLVLFTDFTKPSYNIKLKISIKGQGISITSKPQFFEGPFALQPGVPVELSGGDLYNLLNSQNLDFSGITKAQYEQKKVLPEGFYSVCVTAYDYNNPTPIQVSNEACAQAWMILSDPPFLNLPVCGSTVSIINPQQLSFSFTQMNMGSPNSAANTEFVFELWEIRPQGAVANNIVQTVPPIYTYSTNLTLVNYGLTEPPLLPGMEYAWRVKARDITGRDYFKNNGYSQVCTFTYGSAFDGLSLDLHIHAQAVSQRQIKVWWDSLANFSSYKLEYRKLGGANWFPVTTPNARVRILDLEPQTTYEFKAQGVSNEYTSPFTNPVNATTQPLPDYQCGELPGALPGGNFTPLLQANVGMIWQVGQFEMRVLALQNPMSTNGHFSGYGQIDMPFIKNVNCSFENISVSNEQVVVQGKVNALTTGMGQWINDHSTGTIQDGTEEAEITIGSPLTIGDFQVNTGNGTVVVGGTTYTYTPNGITVEDSNGNLFIVTADGQVIQAGTSGSGHGAVPESKNFIVTDRGVVQFNESTKQMWGTDKYKHPSLVNYYLEVRNLTIGSKEPVDWKSVMAQKYDVIDLKYQVSGGLKEDSILFRTGTGTVYKPQGSGTNRQLYVIGGKHGDVQELFACYRYSKDSMVNIAKLNVVSYRQEQHKVVFVPLGTGVTIDKAQLQKDLNAVYKQAVANWEVEVAPAITVADTLWDKDGNGRFNVGSDIFSRYSNEMKAVNRYVRAQSYYSKEKYYLVVTAKPTDSLMQGLLGEMPRGRNIGYLFTPSPTAKVVAHELGHGAFALEHSFDGNAQLPRGTSACLMDYADGPELYKGKYWDYVHDPTTVIGVTEGDDDGAIVVDNEYKWIMNFFNRIKRACVENKPVAFLKVECGKMYQARDVYVGGRYYKFVNITVPVCSAHHLACNPKGHFQKSFGSNPVNPATYDCVNIDNLINIFVPDGAGNKLIEFLDQKNFGKNLLIFSNGYRPNPPKMHHEHPDEADEVNFADRFGYWGGIDALFIDRIGTKNVVYMDGHASVSTSNHETEEAFTLNYSDWFCFSGKVPLAYLGGVAPLSAANCVFLYHNTFAYQLHTTPNNTGFLFRRNSGTKAGLDLIEKIKSGLIPFDPSRDSIDIVSHSMGHAYACGIIDALKGSSLKFKFGRFYSLAPENPCSSNGAIDFSIFEEVWQYGTNENNPKWDQDGVAPQCPITGIEAASGQNSKRYGRIHFPEKFDPKDYLGSHSIVSYFWIFSDLKPNDPRGGYVKKR